jgi:thiamine-phosphate pyrophosphorylase
VEQVDLRLYAIVDPEHTGGHDLVDLTRAVAAGGATLVQLRDKVSATPVMIEKARALKAALAPFGVPLIINDRVDVALAVEAGGVHVGQEDMSVEEARSSASPSAPSSRLTPRRSPFSTMSGSAASTAPPPRRAARLRSGSRACAA